MDTIWTQNLLLIYKETKNGEKEKTIVFGTPLPTDGQANDSNSALFLSDHEMR